MESANEFSSRRDTNRNEETLHLDLELAAEAEANTSLSSAPLTEHFPSSKADLLNGVKCNDVESVQQAIQNGADLNCLTVFADVEHGDNVNPLIVACLRGYDEIVRILLDAGANTRWNARVGSSAIEKACRAGHLAIVEMLLNHDKDLLEIADYDGFTPLFVAIDSHQNDIVRFLLSRGANVHATEASCWTTLMVACKVNSLESVRLLLAAGVDLRARDEGQRTALHYAAFLGDIQIVRELIPEHNDNMLAVDIFGDTPFDFAAQDEAATADAADYLLQLYGNKVTQEEGRLALHVILSDAEYSYPDDQPFHPPLNPLQIRLPLGKLTFKHFRTLLRSIDTDLMIRHPDDSRKWPIHVACQTIAPIEVLSILVEMDPSTLQVADNSGSLPIHLSCCCEYASVRYLVEQGGVGTLAARNHDGAMPLHLFLCGSTNPSLRTVQYLIQSCPRSVAARTYEGHYPFMIAAGETSAAAALSVLFEIVRANPNLLLPN